MDRRPSIQRPTGSIYMVALIGALIGALMVAAPAARAAEPCPCFSKASVQRFCDIRSIRQAAKLFAQRTKTQVLKTWSGINRKNRLYTCGYQTTYGKAWITFRVGAYKKKRGYGSNHPFYYCYRKRFREPTLGDGRDFQWGIENLNLTRAQFADCKKALGL